MRKGAPGVTTANSPATAKIADAYQRCGRRRRDQPVNDLIPVGATLIDDRDVKHAFNCDETVLNAVRDATASGSSRDAQRNRSRPRRPTLDRAENVDGLFRQAG
jgi:hypothetical protein